MRKDAPRIDNRSEQIGALKQYISDKIKISWSMNDVPKDVQMKFVALSSLLYEAEKETDDFVRWYNTVYSDDPN